MASWTPLFFVCPVMLPAGIIPLPSPMTWSFGPVGSLTIWPHNSIWSEARTLSFVSPAIQPLVAFLKRLPGHQSGYRPVRCRASS